MIVGETLQNLLAKPNWKSVANVAAWEAFSKGEALYAVRIKESLIVKKP